jgi:pyruvate ferredoxin oxidoreductase gamma subunit
MDDSLLIEAAGQVFHGVEANTPIIVNADPQLYLGKIKVLPVANYLFIDFDQIARQSTGHAFVSAPAAAAAAKCVPAISWDQLAQAVRREISEFGLAADLVEKNLDAARAAYELAPCLDLFAVGKVETIAEVSWPAVPYLGTSQFAGPTIRRRASAALRETGNWRTERPEIDLAKCKRCFLCYLYCPEAAMRLDAENFPHVDYDHCKGCMICYEECPTEAISRKTEG